MQKVPKNGKKHLAGFDAAVSGVWHHEMGKMEGTYHKAASEIKRGTGKLHR